MTTGAEAACACPESRALSRRGFLRGATLAAGAAVATGVSARVSHAADGASSDGVLVVLSLRGGMDGLSVVAPLGDPDYTRLRPTIAVPTGAALPTGDPRFGLHPALAPLHPLWEAGAFGAVHAVDTPDRSRSHFAATEELERAAPGTSLRTGWLDRVVGTRATGAVFQSVQLGSASPKALLAGPQAHLAARSLRDFRIQQDASMGPRLDAARLALHTGVEGPAVDAARRTLSALAEVQAVNAATGPENGATYPDSPLGRALADTARLVRHGRGLQSVCLDHGDWDMHAGLGAYGGGWMARQLADVAGALAAFARDLGPLMRRVTVVTLSEFGRRAAENGSGGTDHGHGNAVLLLGEGLLGGRVHGRWPGLSAGALDRGDLAGTTDYRDVLGELLVRRTGLPTSALAEAFPGHRPAFLGLTGPAA